MSFIIKILVSGLVVLLGAYLLPGVHVVSFGTALIVAIVLAILNTLVKPLLILLTIPSHHPNPGVFLIGY